MDDVLLIGGGAIGCASAIALATRGLRVRLVERGRVGEEASSAAAGILGAYAEAHGHGPLTDLCLRSLAMYGAWAEELFETTGVDVGYRRCGSMRVFFDAAAMTRGTEEAAGFGDAVAVLRGAEVNRREPNVSALVVGAIEHPEDGRVDPASLMAALVARLRGANVRLNEGAEVERIEVENGRAVGARLRSGDVVRAGAVVITAGAWSLLSGSGLHAGTIEPVRGQMVELQTNEPPLGHVVFGPNAYLSPRDDGRVIVGSTQERVGFHKAVTASGIQGLLEGAIRCVPHLAGAEIRRTWSGLRPATPDDSPLLGAAFVPNLFLAAGHFRNGILLTPVTAEIVGALVAGQPEPFDLTPFRVDRFA